MTKKRGRPRKLDKLKELEGTKRADREYSYLKVKVLDNIPEPPEDLNLDEMGIKMWNYHIPGLVNNKIISDLDLVSFAVYCNEVSRYFRLNEYIKENGETYINNSGTSSARPEVLMMKNSWSMASDLASKFGLTPLARENMKGKNEDEKGNDLINLLNEK